MDGGSPVSEGGAAAAASQSSPASVCVSGCRLMLDWSAAEKTFPAAGGPAVFLHSEHLALRLLSGTVPL